MILPPEKTSKLMLAPKHLALVRGVLKAHAPHHRAYVFGSRVVANAADRARLKPHSDLDLALEGPRLKLHQAYALREAFSESDLPSWPGWKPAARICRGMRPASPS